MKRGCVPGRTRGLTITMMLFLAALLGAAGSAGAAGGGMSAPGVPTIRDVICTAGCVGLRAPTPGGTVQVTGSDLTNATKMSFPATGGGRSLVAISGQTATSGYAQVPDDAADGKVRVRDDFGNVSNLSPTALDIRPQSELGSSGPLQLLEAQVTPRTAFYDGVEPPSLTYVIGSSQAQNDLRIDVLDANGGIVRSFFPKGVAPNTTRTQIWAGKTSAGSAAPNGSYSFRVSSVDGRRAHRASASDVLSLRFQLYGYIFPVRGSHDFGSAGSRFGAPRAGHTHQGQDVAASCGVPLVAARGGTVKYSGYQAAGAGNYIVIDGKATGHDFVYMHLMHPSPLRTGQRVRTGQKIGVVGETGDAVGCHLHFEMWSAPGWYTGGSPFDPLPYLKRWDRYS